MREKPEVQAKVLGMGVAEKWMMLQSYRQKVAKEQAEREMGDHHNDPEEWIRIVNVEPTANKMQESTIRKSAIRKQVFRHLR